MQGRLVIEKFEAVTQRVVAHIETRNLVVTTGYTALTQILGGVTPAAYSVNRMQFGTSSGAPSDGDVGLAMPITPIKAISTYTYPDVAEPYRLIMEAYLLSTEGNGFIIAEAGLLSSNNTLIARALFPTTIKDSSHILHFTWTISS